MKVTDEHDRRANLSDRWVCAVSPHIFDASDEHDA